MIAAVLCNEDDRALNASEQAMASRLQAAIDAAPLAAISAVVGGVVAQELLHAIGNSERPLPECFLFNGHTGAGEAANLPR